MFRYVGPPSLLHHYRWLLTANKIAIFIVTPTTQYKTQTAKVKRIKNVGEEDSFDLLTSMISWSRWFVEQHPVSKSAKYWFHKFFPQSCSGLFLKRVSPMYVITTKPFSCVSGHLSFSAWWHPKNKQTTNQVILEQACSRSVRRQSFALHSIKRMDTFWILVRMMWKEEVQDLLTARF